MPIFEYRCLSCGQEFEVLQMKRRKRKGCPVCASKNIRKLISRCLTIQTDQQRVSQFTPEQSRSPNFYRDPRNIGLSTEHKLKKMGVDLGDAFQEKLAKARSVKNIDDVGSL